MVRFSGLMQVVFVLLIVLQFCLWAPGDPCTTDGECSGGEKCFDSSANGYVGEACVVDGSCQDPTTFCTTLSEEPCTRASVGGPCATTTCSWGASCVAVSNSPEFSIEGMYIYLVVGVLVLVLVGFFPDKMKNRANRPA